VVFERIREELRKGNLHFGVYAGLSTTVSAPLSNPRNDWRFRGVSGFFVNRPDPGVAITGWSDWSANIYRGLFSKTIFHYHRAKMDLQSNEL